MWTSRISVKLFLVYAVLNLSLAVGYVTLVARWQRQLLNEQIEARLLNTTTVLRDYLSEILDEKDHAELQAWVRGMAEELEMRITLVDPHGDVWADSREDPGQMENHANRPELKQALANGFGKSSRFSNTLKMQMTYVALSLERDGQIRALVRIAMPMSEVEQQVATMHQSVWLVALITGAIALGLTLLGATRIMRPLSSLTEAAEAIADGEYNQRIPINGHDELATLGRAVDHMRRELMSRMNALTDNSQRLETVLSSMVEGVLAVDAEQHVLFANEASRHLLGIETSEIVDRALLEVTRQRPLVEAVMHALVSEEAWESEFETLGNDRRLLATRATRLPGLPCPGVVLVLYDITDLRRLESIRREFVANVSHELKTPLSSIKAYAETLHLGAINDTENNLRFVQRIEEQAERLNQLIMDLLQLARVESGRETFEIQRVALDEFAVRCESNQHERAELQHLQYDLELPDESILVNADEEGLLTILDNLFANALQYTPAGGRITVRVYAEADRAIMEVKDTGVGIALADQQRVFERFYRVDKARSRDLGGTGLGLAIVKHLTQSFGGEVGLLSQPGQGSTFQIRLPRVANAATLPLE